jgi:glycine cleavage system transcriptional repressor
MQQNASTALVVSVLDRDRVGILRDITAVVADLGANIDGIAQTVMAGYFTVLLTATFTAPRDPDAVRRALEAGIAGGTALVSVRPRERDAAHRTVPSRRYILTLVGPDRPGILKRVTAFLAERAINIEDWTVGYSGPIVTYVGELSVPARLDIKQLQDECARLMGNIDLSVHIQHENIFRVTSEVGGVSPLLQEDGGAA